MRLGLLSDVHLRSSDADAVVATLQDIVRHFNTRFQPDHVVVLGDLIEDESPAADRDHLRTVVEELSALDAPVTFLAGNHDVERVPPTEFSEIVGNPRWGRIADTPVVYLDSAAPHLAGAPGYVSDEQLTFLDGALAELDEALLLVHHPIHHRSLADNVWFSEAPERAFLVNKRDVLAVVEEHASVRAVFNGHVHETHHARFRGLDHFTVNAVNKETPDSGVTGTYTEVELASSLSVTVVEGDRRRVTVTLD